MKLQQSGAGDPAHVADRLRMLFTKISLRAMRMINQLYQVVADDEASIYGV